MANTEPITVIKRLVDDDFIHAQLADAGEGARDAYRRLRRLPPEKAVQDKAVYDRIRQVVTGLTAATRRALGRPEPEPQRRHRGLVVVILLAVGAVVVWAAKNHDRTARTPTPPGAQTSEPTSRESNPTRR